LYRVRAGVALTLCHPNQVLLLLDTMRPEDMLDAAQQALGSWCS